ncbi:rhodanese-like domain-containing protein [Tolumonas lignilytica]|uniref:rhodanese-like domain-containing protein n=1 Tax=Tolumonas lignilytica TaxID=1283284 RepID=UPI000465D790|nr:rhodanese-like domain-containing protein [Tolumonas lignilytica]
MQEYIDFAMRHEMLVLAWIGLATAVVASAVKGALSPVKQIDHQAAVALINKQDALIVDVRAQDEFARGHIANSHHIPLAQIEQGNTTEIDKHKEKPVIIVCETGSRAETAATKLSKSGFTQVYLLRGGLTQWRSSNLPVTKKR